PGGRLASGLRFCRGDPRCVRAPRTRRRRANERGRMRSRLNSALALLAAVVAAGCMPPSWGANALLHPQRRPMTLQPHRPFDAVVCEGEGVKLTGWWFHAPNKRGTVVFLHGLSDNRGNGVGIAAHSLDRGYDVIEYDSRAHGESEGDACTYGFYEKQDLRRVLDPLRAEPSARTGGSLGAG